jgi:hypothetical protein
LLLVPEGSPVLAIAVMGRCLDDLAARPCDHVPPRLELGHVGRDAVVGDVHLPVALGWRASEVVYELVPVRDVLCQCWSVPPLHLAGDEEVSVSVAWSLHLAGDEEVSVSVAWTTVVHSRKVGAFRFKAGAFDSIAKAERVRHRTFQRGRGTTGCVLHGLTD